MGEFLHHDNGMKRRLSRHPARSRWFWIIALSLVLQLPVFYAFVQLIGDSDGPDRLSPLRMHLVGYTPQAKKPEAKPEPLPENARVVQVPEAEVTPPEDELITRNLADRRARVEKERQARLKRNAHRNKARGKARPRQPSVVQSRESTQSEPTQAPKQDENMALAPAKSALLKADEGLQPQDSLLFRGPVQKIQIPTTTERGRIARLQGMSADFASNDYLDDVEKSDSTTLLNANKYKYADFFYRVKDAVRRHWHPDRVYRSRDPTGRVYGVKDRYTVLRVTLDGAGALKRLVTMRDSGLDFMDAEALGAFKRAGPFPNPPHGLVNAGEVDFQFGFYFEISSGRHRFGWKKL